MDKHKKSIIVAWAMWLIAAIFYGLDYFQHTAPSVLIRPIADSLGNSVADVGTILGVYFPVYAASQIPAGILLDRYGVKLVLAIMCCLMSIGLYIMSIPSEITLYAGRILVAIGSAFAFLGALKVSASWLPKSIFPLAVGMVNTVGVIGGIFGQAFLNYLILKLGWQHAILAISLFGVFWSLIILAFLRTSANQNDLVEQHRFHWPVLLDKQIWIIAIYAGIMVGTVVNAFSELYDVVFLQSSFSIGSQKAALISSMIFIGIGIGGPSHGLIVRWFKYQRTWMLSSVLLTALFFLLVVCASVLHLSYVWLYPMYFFTGFFVSSMLLSFNVARCCYDKDVHATIFGVVNMVIGLCGFSAQWLLGHLLKYYQHGTGDVPSQTVFMHSLWFIVLALMVSALLCIKIKRR